MSHLRKSHSKTPNAKTEKQQLILLEHIRNFRDKEAHYNLHGRKNKLHIKRANTNIHPEQREDLVDFQEDLACICPCHSEAGLGLTQICTCSCIRPKPTFVNIIVPAQKIEPIFTLQRKICPNCSSRTDFGSLMQSTIEQGFCQKCRKISDVLTPKPEN